VTASSGRQNSNRGSTEKFTCRNSLKSILPEPSSSNVRKTCS